PELDAILIADSGVDTLSGTNPLKLHLDGRVGAIQVVSNFIENAGRIIEPVSGDNQFSWSSAPKLNGIYLYSYLTRNNLRVELIHNYVTEKERFINLLAHNPKAVIISTSFIFFKKTLRNLVADIRSIAPDIFIIAGGAFVYYSYLLLERSGKPDYETRLAEEDFLFLSADNEPDIDLYIVHPRGESTLKTALKRLNDGHALDLLENTACRSGKSYFFGPRSDVISHLQSIEIDWDTLPQSMFKTGVIPLQASNGCPYNCSFCNFTKDPRLTFVKPIDLLVAELKSVEQRGIKYVWFVDDNFRMGRADLNAVCMQFINNNIGIKWMCFIRASTLMNADMELLRKAGCIEVQIGLESGDPQILKNMNKQADPAMYAEVIGKVMHHGINVSCYFISGFPGETETTAATTRKFIRSIENPDAPGSLSWSIYPFLLTPLSPVYEPEMRSKFELKGYLTNWTHKTMDFQQAKKLVAKAFFELENSGPIYREDNLVYLEKMTTWKKKEFFKSRHSLAKKSMRNQLQPDEIIHSFNDVIK
ncbi:MAG: radical SAM protein, partial [Desulfobulbaceae bacterium]|nr:radical SAM protein [Desulfobulbaceae bacterium]